MNVQSSPDSTHVPLAERPTRILKATLELVSEEGLTGFSIGKLAKRAASSSGIIYHYFESKDMLIHTLYKEVLAKSAFTLTDDNYALPPFERLKTLWLNTFDFYTHHPQETIFLEQYKHSAYYSQRLPEADAPLERLITVFQADIARGVFKDLPLSVLQAMTLDVAISLAKGVVAGRVELDEATLHTVADTVCQSVLH